MFSAIRYSTTRCAEDKGIATFANVIRLLLLFEKNKTDVSKETLRLGV